MTTYRTVQTHWNKVAAAAAVMAPADMRATLRNGGAHKKSGSKWEAFHAYLHNLQGKVCATCGQPTRLARDSADDAAGLFLAVPATCYPNRGQARVGHVEGVHVSACQSCRESINEPLKASALAIPADAIVLHWEREMFKLPKAKPASKHKAESLRILQAKGYNV